MDGLQVVTPTNDLVEATIPSILSLHSLPVALWLLMLLLTILTHVVIHLLVVMVDGILMDTIGMHATVSLVILKLQIWGVISPLPFLIVVPLGT